MDLEPHTQQRLGHCGALDVPSGPPPPPRRIPRRVLALLLRFPQREIERVPLALGSLDLVYLIHLIDLPMANFPVSRV